MAKKATAKMKAVPSDGKAGGRSSRSLWLIVLGVLIISIGLPTVMILVVGMLPTIVALIVDRTPQKYAPFCVGGMNFSGVFPSLLTLWTTTHSFSRSLDILADPYALLVMYGAAGFGWMLYMAIPPVISTFVTVIAQRRSAQLRAIQKRLLDEWGDAVAKGPAQRR